MFRIFSGFYFPFLEHYRTALILTGVALILFAFLIIAFPQILILLIASLFMAAGILSLFVGWRIRQPVSNSSEIKININE